MGHSSKTNQTLLGIFAIIVGVFFVALHDALVKLYAADLSFSQFFTLRSAIALPLLAGVIWLRPANKNILAALRNPWVLARAFSLAMMYLSLYISLIFIPLSTLAAGFYIAPIFIALFSALVIKEPVSGKNWIALAIGFIGVLISLNLFAESFTPYAIMPIFGGFFYAVAAIITRSKCQDYHPLTLTFALVVVLGLIGLVMSLALLWLKLDATIVAQSPFLLGPWIAISATFVGQLIMFALLFLGLGILVATAYQIAPPAIIASFDYSFLVFAAILGFLLFGEVPNTLNIIGMVLIIGAGVYSARNAT